MKAPAILAAAALFWTTATPPPGLDPPGDDQLHFPALQTTIREPRADQGALTACATLDGQRRCDEALGDAWCRKQGFGGGFVEWTTRRPVIDAGCDDARDCTAVTTITCKGVPIMGD
ncbi:MAG TPA: hypothetical protein VG407_13250 [Caulobacteraceae bacterium]|jgi:hypothetical protein|nr:hypothetical protein [Caulobacteraceae bacterium]